MIVYEGSAATLGIYLPIYVHDRFALLIKHLQVDLSAASPCAALFLWRGRLDRKLDGWVGFLERELTAAVRAPSVIRCSEAQADYRAATHHHWCETGMAGGTATALRKGARCCGRAAGAGSRSEVMMTSLLSTPLRSIGV